MVESQQNDETQANSTTADAVEIPAYKASRGEPELADIPLDPTDGRRLQKQLDQYPDTGLERDLIMVAKRLRSHTNTAQAQRRRTSQQTSPVNVNRERLRPHGNPPAARRSNTASRNRRAMKLKFAKLTERYFQAVRGVVENE
jgi:hypothetical protein